jgi:hypothetical protein
MVCIPQTGSFLKLRRKIVWTNNLGEVEIYQMGKDHYQ